MKIKGLTLYIIIVATEVGKRARIAFMEGSVRT